MKILGMVMVLLASGVLGLQVSAQNTNAAHVDTLGTTNYQVVYQDGNSRVWERDIIEKLPNGKTATKIHKYTELATGMNHLINGQWVHSSDAISILPNGTFAATNGQHQVYWPTDIANGSIKLVMPNGTNNQSQPVALSYDDGSNSVLIAVLTNSIGQVVGTNQVVYANAFCGLNADLLYTYRKSGFEQDVVIHEQPPTPESLGLNPATTRLQVLTEFSNRPRLVKPISTKSKGNILNLIDHTMDFGKMQMVPGKAFSLSKNKGKMSTPVYKSWMTMSGRQILLEEVPLTALTNQLENLPATAQIASRFKAHKFAGKLELPPQHLAKSGHHAVKLARTELRHDSGLVLDYNTVDFIDTNYCDFEANQTYYISGDFYSGYATEFDPGAILKYARGASVTIIRSSYFQWLGQPYQPIVFTAVDDNTLGEVIDGSTGSPSGYYANPALGLTYMGNLVMSNYRINYAEDGVLDYGSTITNYNCQFENCQYAWAATYGTEKFCNALFANINCGFQCSEFDDIDGQNCTFAYMSNCIASVTDDANTFTEMTNCVFVDVTNFYVGSQNLYVGDPFNDGNANIYLGTANNGIYPSNGYGFNSPGIPFQSAGAGNYYLAADSTYHNVGTTNIDPLLLASLFTRTTYPPTVYAANSIISNNTALGPTVPRDTNAAPDIGYHYDPIDYLVDQLAVTNATLFLTNGVVIGACSSNGIELQDGSSIVSVGTPTAPNWIVRYNTAQEQSIFIDGTNNYASLLLPLYQAAMPSASFEFTKFASVNDNGYELYDVGNSSFSNLLVQNSEFWGGADELGGTNGSTISFFNNAFVGTIINATGSGTLGFTNNLVWESPAVMLNPLGGATWSAFNNDFDTSTITNSTLICGYNAYLGCVGNLEPTDYSSDIFSAGSLQYYWPGPFGLFYQQDDSMLIGMGNTNANLLGLYHFTVTTNQLIEGTNIVSIGYHYVATDTNGIPLDSNGDGIPDYLEDANGDGIYDAGDLGNWLGTNVTTTLSIVGGNNQSGIVSQFMAQPLTVQVAGSDGSPLSNILVTFTVVEGGGGVALATNTTTTNYLQVTSGSNGEAAVWFSSSDVAPATNYISASIPNGTSILTTNLTEITTGLTSSTTTISMLAVGGERIIELTTNENVLCWGGNQFGEFGDYTHVGSMNPVHVPGLTNIIQIASGLNHSLAIDANGTLWAWGDNEYGQLGDGGSESSTNLPVEVFGMSNSVVSIAGGHETSVAAKSDGTVWLWGTVELGYSSSTWIQDYTTPTQIIVPTNALAVAAGEFHMLALCRDGSVWAWGQDFDGVLGNGAIGDDSDTPVQVIGLSNIVAVCSGDRHSLALDSNGCVWAWGLNDSGQLGDGEAEFASSLPILVLTNVVKIAAGASHSVAIDAQGNLWAWGSDNAGQLGDNGSSTINTPTRILDISNLVSIAAGSDATAALDINGNVWEFGSSDSDGINWIWNGVNGYPHTSPNYFDYYNSQLPVLNKLSGNNQVGHGGSEFAQPLSFKVTDAGGHALSNAPVSVEIIYGDMELRTNSDGTNFKGLRLTTDVNGEVSLIGFADADLLNTNCLIRVLAESDTQIAEVDFSETLVQSPTINITDPIDGSVILLRTNQTLTITVDAEATSGLSMQEVDYSDGTNGIADTPLGISSVNPYTFTWTNALWWTNAFIGQYTLSAVAVDSSGGQSEPAQDVTVTIALDTDGNGLPDYWQMKYFGHLGMNTNSDPDGNGQSLLYDYENGINPTDYYNGNLPSLQIIGGNDQAGNYGSFLPIPVTIEVNQLYETTFFTNAPVTFAVTNGTALLGASVDDVPTNFIKLRTDSNGLASAWVYFPAASTNPPDSTILATASSGTNSVAVTINEYVPLGHWTFNNTNSWAGEQGQVPLLATNLAGVPDWSSNAVWIDSTNPSWLAYNVVETNGSTNIDCQTGSVMFWFRPDWSSANAGGNGPGDSGRLIEIGNYNPAFTNGWWGLYVNPDGTRISFGTSTNGGGSINFTGNISWSAGEWYQVTLIYSTNVSAIYVDGQWLGNGGGVSFLPNVGELASGFRIGSDSNGNEQAKGEFDELETFDYPLSPANTFTASSGLPDWWEIEYFNENNLSPEYIPSGMNTTLLTDYQYGIDPNPINDYLSVANQYVNSNSVPIQVRIASGTPAYVAILVNNTNGFFSITNSGQPFGTVVNFSNAVWQPYGSNVMVSLTNGDGVYEIWVGAKGMSPNSIATWTCESVSLDTQVPIINVTNPVSNTVSQPMIQLQGFANKSLASLSYDLSNADGMWTNRAGYTTGQFCDTNLMALTTNWFQCYDITLSSNGPNIITLRVIDLAGNTFRTNFNYTLDYSSNTNPPVTQLVWPRDGTVIGGTNFVIEGTVSDPTARVMATIINASGNTNNISGLVSRNGNIWIEGVPLSNGTNEVTITAIDAGGYSSSTNIHVLGDDVGLVVNSLASAELNKSLVTVTGSIGESTNIVTVNGVRAVVSADGTWEADLVPVNPSGTANFSVVISDNYGNQIAEQSTLQEQPANINIMSYSSVSWNNGVHYDQMPTAYNDLVTGQYIIFPTLQPPNFSNQKETINWSYQSGGLDSNYYLEPGYFDAYFFPGEEGISSIILPAGDGGYNPQWKNCVASATGVFNGGTGFYSNGQNSQTHVIINPPDQTTPGMTNAYLVSAQAWDYSNLTQGEQLPSSSLEIRGEALTQTTNTDGSIWGDTFLQAPAGVKVDVTPTAGTPSYLFNVQAKQLTMQMAVDANRDGKITFDSQDQTSEQNPYRFWVNDNHDGYAKSENLPLSISSDSVQDDLDPMLGNDATSNTISCTRDLEDYTRLWINTQDITNELANGTLLLALKWKNFSGDPAIRIFLSKDANGGTGYLTDTNAANNQLVSPYNSNIIDLSGQDFVSSSEPFFFDPNFVESLYTNSTAHLLFDGISSGSGGLVLALYKSDKLTEVGESAPVYLSLNEITNMYESWTVGEGNGTAPSVTATNEATFTYSSSSPESDQYIVFVHGWNCSPLVKTQFANTAYKRLWWQGYRGRFGAFRWPCGYAFPSWSSQGTNLRNYDDSESNSWASATGLADLLENLNVQYPGSVYMFAHSQGNAAAGEALRIGGETGLVNTYVACEAAISAHAFDSMAVNWQSAGVSNSPDLFADWTNGLPYLSKVTNVVTCADFYNTNDWALALWKINQTTKPDHGISFPGYYWNLPSSSYPSGYYKLANGFQINLYIPENTYEILAFCIQSPCYALGATANVNGLFDQSLPNLWQPDPFESNPNKLYSDHPWHSAEFLFSNAEQTQFWNTLLNKFGLLNN